ncbi:MAG TPA: hypothetical protein VJ794_09305 [Gemmatimonadales bacterium]|nr:hypothetical protein [Gemmatimonadales bacterium]
MTPKLLVLAGAIALTVVFLSPIAYLAGERAGVWLTTPTVEPTGPWPSLDEAEPETGPADRFKPSVRPGFGQI